MADADEPVPRRRRNIRQQREHRNGTRPDGLDRFGDAGVVGRDDRQGVAALSQVRDRGRHACRRKVVEVVHRGPARDPGRVARGAGQFEPESLVERLALPLQ